MKKIMYLHGFASSGASGTDELLRREFWEKAHEDRALCHGLFGDEDDTVLASETRPVFEQHYPGMSSSFSGGHRLNAHVVVHTLLPYIRGLNLF